MIDTHCHIEAKYFDNISDLIDKIIASGVDRIIVNGCDMQSNLEVLDLIKKYDIVYGAIGFHPTELVVDDSNYISFLEEHINDKKIVAVGEIGLDYHYDNTNKDLQIMAFKKQLDIATKYKKPVIVHSRDAINDTYDILANYSLTGSIHCFSGSLEMANKFIKLGYLLGIGGVCTYKNAKNIVNVIKKIDLSYILLETDSPYLSPEPCRSSMNTPCNIKIIARKVAEIKGISISSVCSSTTSNACRIFDF